MDGACKDGVIGCWGVIRGKDGEWLTGFLKIVGRGEAYVAKLLGLLQGLKLARSMDFSRVEVRFHECQE